VRRETAVADELADEIQCDQRTGNLWQDSLLARYTTIATG
jgi:hypothetical protein